MEEYIDLTLVLRHMSV